LVIIALEVNRAEMRLAKGLLLNYYNKKIMIILKSFLIPLKPNHSRL